MRSKVVVFELTPDGSAVPGSPVEVEAAHHDALRAAATAALTARYARVRSIGFTPTGLVAYVVPRVG
jgi:hypothetical protein